MKEFSIKSYFKTLLIINDRDNTVCKKIDWEKGVLGLPIEILFKRKLY